MREAGLIYRRAEVGAVKLMPPVVKVLCDSRQLKGEDLESGGVLLGRLVDDCRDVLVDAVGRPGAKDRRGRMFFRRARASAQRLVKRSWRRSGGRQNYLGEWHTHPESFPQPSLRDVEEWKRIVREAEYDQGFLIFVIVGTVEIRVWEVDRDRCELAQCQ